MLTRKSIKIPLLSSAIPETVASNNWKGEVIQLRAQVNALRKEHYEFMRSVDDYLKALNNKGALTISQATFEASNGIKFPATQVPSSDVNTLDDYEEATNWTPVLTFATPGDLAVAYTIQVGDATKIGREVTATFRIQTSSFTHTTAAGDLRITGLPYTAANDASFIWSGAIVFGGITKATYTQITAQAAANSNILTFTASGSGVAAANVTAADMPTGGSVRIRGTIIYRF